MATLTETFTNIADAIRLKTETTDKITPENMPSMIEGITTGGNVAELSITSNGTYRAPEGIDGYTPVIVNVPQDGAPVAEGLVITGDCERMFYNGKWDWFIRQYGNQMTTNNITNADRMFYNSTLDNIPFDINMSRLSSYTTHKLQGTFQFCSKMKQLPRIKGDVKPNSLESFFYYHHLVREIPEDYFDDWDWSEIDGNTSSYGGTMCNNFYYCYSLRKAPAEFIKHGNPKAYGDYSLYKKSFISCYALDELVDVAVPYTNVEWTTNAFANYGSDYFLANCWRIKDFTFAVQEDGTPYVVKWKGQNIRLTSSQGVYFGYANDNTFYNLLDYNSGITEDKRVVDDATYQALKNDPDWWSTNYNYSRYNHESAVRTINSLPDTSAYLATKGGTNTIIFGYHDGKLTDGGSTGDLTEEEIAVATAKGWTVSFG